VESKEDKELREMEARHPALKWWGDKLQKMNFDIKKPMFHYSNLKATLWIIAFNPMTWPFYLIFIIMAVYYVFIGSL